MRQISQCVRNARLADSTLIWTVFRLAFEISKHIDVAPCEWRDFIYFLAGRLDEFGVDAEAYERSVDLESLEPGDQLGEKDTKTFEETLQGWFNDRLCHAPGRHRRYHIRREVKSRFIVIATLLQLVFPRVFRGEPRWRLLKQNSRWRALEAAWADETQRLKNRQIPT